MLPSKCPTESVRKVKTVARGHGIEGKSKHLDRGLTFLAPQQAPTQRGGSHE